MRRYLLLITFALAFTPWASAQVTIELSQDGVVVERKVLSDLQTITPDPSSPLLSTPSPNTKGGGGITPDTTWVVPRYSIDDSTANGSSTFVSIRHSNSTLLDTNVSIEYFNEIGVLRQQEDIVLTPRETRILTLRDNPFLVNPGGIATGVIAVKADSDLIVDYFQVDFGDNFASGSLAPKLSDFCDFWIYRFLTFGGDSGTQIAFTLNAPMGPDPAPPSVTGNIYSEAGNFINSFTIRTGNFLFDVPASELVVGGAKFGSMEITIDTIGPLDFPGYVIVNHNAFGRFSVGHDAVCIPPDIT